MSLPLYVTISNRVNSRDRLNWLKKDAEKHNANVKSRGYGSEIKSWRERRYSGFHNALVSNCALSSGSNGKHPIWYTHCGPEFRDERDASDVIRLDHTGWYVDSDQYSTIKGIVARLPHGRFLAGTFESENGERVYYPEIYEDEKEAARAADHYAERVAEEQREYNERYEEARAIEDEIESSIETIKTFYKMRHTHRYGIKYVIDEVKENVNKIRVNREKLKEFSDVL